KSRGGAARDRRDKSIGSPDLLKRGTMSRLPVRVVSAQRGILPRRRARRPPCRPKGHGSIRVAACFVGRGLAGRPPCHPGGAGCGRKTFPASLCAITTR